MNSSSGEGVLELRHEQRVQLRDVNRGPRQPHVEQGHPPERAAEHAVGMNLGRVLRHCTSVECHAGRTERCNKEVNRRANKQVLVFLFHIN